MFQHTIWLTSSWVTSIDGSQLPRMVTTGSMLGNEEGSRLLRMTQASGEGRCRSSFWLVAVDSQRELKGAREWVRKVGDEDPRDAFIRQATLRHRECYRAQSPEKGPVLIGEAKEDR